MNYDVRFNGKATMRREKATQFDKYADRQNFKRVFLESAELTGEYGFPKIRAADFTAHNLVPFNMAKTHAHPETKWLHFFIDDYQFERLWNYPKRYIELLKKYEGVITPDFSMYTDMPKAQQIWNCYRNRATAYWMQKNDINIIPCVEWAGYTDFDWCLDGLPINSTLAIGLYGANKSSVSKYALLKGIERICNDLIPKRLICYGKEIKSIKSLCENTIFIENYCNSMKKRL